MDRVMNRFSVTARVIILFQLLTSVVILLDVAYLRQIVGFIYLMFLPGFVILKMLKWDESESLETVLFSVGLSIALLMFIGLLANELGAFVGFTSPLTLLPLLVILNIVVLLPCFLGFLKDGNATILDSPKPLGVLLFILPILSVVAALLINNYQENSLSLLMILIISGLIVLGVVFRKLFPTRLYPLILFVISVALLFHGSLISNYIVGYDAHGEYHVYESTATAGHWTSGLFSWDDRITKANAMLSVTILPTIFSQITGIDGTWIFKILYPLILSFVPLVLYQVYFTQNTKKEAAFLSVFLIVSSLTFFGIEGFPAKQMVAEFFFVLLFLVILKEKMNGMERNCLFVVFGAALVVSHYSLSYIFLFVILSTWLYYFLIRRRQMVVVITLNKALLFFSIAFAWYIYTSSSAPFDAIMATGDHIYRTFYIDFFNPAARSATVLRGLGVAEAVSLGHQVGRIFFYLTEFLVVIGFVQMVFKKNPVPFSRKYTWFSFLFVAILGMTIILPNLAGSFRMERFYHVAILIIAPLVILGGETLSRLLFKQKNSALALSLVLLVLIPNFLFETGFIYEVTNDVSYYLPFGMQKVKGIQRLVFLEQEVLSAKWLSKYINVSRKVVYADSPSALQVLTSYGRLTTENTPFLYNTTESLENRAYVYLRQENLLDDTMVTERLLWNTSNISSLLDNQNKIYSNGASEILWVPERTSPISP